MFPKREGIEGLKQMQNLATFCLPFALGVGISIRIYLNPQFRRALPTLETHGTVSSKTSTGVEVLQLKCSNNRICEKRDERGKSFCCAQRRDPSNHEEANMYPVLSQGNGVSSQSRIAGVCMMQTTPDLGLCYSLVHAAAVHVAAFT